MDIVLDFDGTCVKHDFPRVGESAPNCVEVLQKLTKKGHRLLLNTMRSNRAVPRIEYHTDRYLDEAIKWFKDNAIPLYGAQKHPTQNTWTDSPKVHGSIYIDDLGLGCPTTTDEKGNVFVDWYKVEQMLKAKGLI